MCNKSYNGFTTAEISAGTAAIADAESRGWRYVRKCEICGNSPRHGAVIVPHCEDWSQPVECVRPLCIFCEDAVVNRFIRPNRFNKLLHLARAGERAPVFTTRAAFNKAQWHGRPDEREDVPRITEPNPSKWWEMLKHFHVDHRSMSKRQFAEIRGPVQNAQVAASLF